MFSSITWVNLSETKKNHVPNPQEIALKSLFVINHLALCDLHFCLENDCSASLGKQEELEQHMLSDIHQSLFYQELTK